VIGPSQRPLPVNTQHSQQTNIHAYSGVRTHDLSRRVAADLRLRPRWHWDRLIDRIRTLLYKILQAYFVAGIFVLYIFLVLTGAIQYEFCVKK